jgi:hypothetical protein
MNMTRPFARNLKKGFNQLETFFNDGWTKIDEKTARRWDRWNNSGGGML